MAKTILLTGATDGIGLLTAKTLAARGHNILLHGRNTAKLDAAVRDTGGNADHFTADLSNLADVKAMAQAVLEKHERVDVLINNAGVLKTPSPLTADGLDVRFVVNTLAPYLLTRLLLPIIPKSGRVVNLSSAAQAPVDLDALSGRVRLGDMEAYAQSKLAITIWTRKLAKNLPDGPVVIAVNPGSLLASKMVREGFGIAGNDLQIGADILCKAALDDSFAEAGGQYYDNDSNRFADPHSAASDADKSQKIMRLINELVADLF